MSKPIYVLGTGLSHEGSACLLRDGSIFVAIEKERITRHKRDGLNDSDAIQYCLNAADIQITDVSLVVQNANFSMLSDSREWFHGPRYLGDVPTVSISHHLAHAYSAIGTSPFERCAVLVVDGCGNAMDDCIDLEGAVVPVTPDDRLKRRFFEKDSYYEFDGRSLRSVYKDFSPWQLADTRFPMAPVITRHSIGGLYLAASTYVFSGFEDPGKLMGLAPYGRPGIYEMEAFTLDSGRVFVNYEALRQFLQPCHGYPDFLGRFQYFADIAYWIQKEIERALLYLAGARAEILGCDRVCYAGGVALNAVANRRLMLEGPFREFHIPPASGDNGLAIGCAYYGWMEVLKRARIPHDGTSYLGIQYDAQAVSAAISAAREPLTVLPSSDVLSDTAAMIADGLIVGWFNGRSEFGPRALGNRSILADPRLADVRSRINARVKLREDFRPFAPAVLAEDRSIYFSETFSSPYMLLVSQVRDEWRSAIPAVIHEDGTARLQTVERSMSPVFYDLISAFKRQTGMGMLLNTSLNRRRMPIVETPAQAIDLFLDVEMDILVLDGTIIIKPALLSRFPVSL